MNNEVVVTNQNPKPFTDGLNGMTWAFKPNEKVTIPLEAAIHIFGLNKKDKITTLRRLGLANHPDGEQWLANIKMDYVEYVRKEDAAEVEQLKIDLEEKMAEADEKSAALEAAQTEITQLKTLLEEALKMAEK